MRKTDFWVQTCLKWPKLSQFQRVHVVQNYVLPTLPSILSVLFLGHPLYSREHHRENKTKNIHMMSGKPMMKLEMMALIN